MNLYGNNPITANGTYVIQKVAPGVEHMCTITGTWGDGTLTVKTVNPITGTTEIPTNGVFTANAEFTFILTGTEIQFILTGATNPSLAVAITPISQ